MKLDIRKKRLLKALGFSGLFALSVTSAIVFPIVEYNNRTYSLSFNHDTTTFEGNKNRINDYIDYVLNPNYNDLYGSLKVYGKEGIVGTEGVELSSNQRSLVTVEEAWENNLFELNLKSSIYYQMWKNNIQSELAYIKPYYSDSSYPVIGIKLFYGSGANYYETIYEYRDTNLYGFKISEKQQLLNYYSNLIESNPLEYFKLKQDIGVVGQVGLYAKKIEVSSFDLNNDKLKELRNKNIWVNVNYLNVDNVNPSLLKVNYTISYNDGETNLSSYSKDIYLGNFDIEQGVDDPKSKLKKFISSNTDWINNLNQYFEYQMLEPSPNETETKESVRDAFKAGRITLITNYSIRSKLESEGIQMEFKTFENEDSKNLSAFNSEFDSTTPTYRLFFTSYYNTPLATTESVLITGTSQEGDFLESQEEKDMNTFYNYLSEAGKGFEDVFELDSTNNNTNPLSLSDYFMGTTSSGSKKVDFTNGKYSIPYELVFDLYEKYTSSENKISNEYVSPFKDFKFKLKDQWNSDSNVAQDIKDIASKILTSINDVSNGGFEIQLDSLTNSSEVQSIKFNIFLGKILDGNIFTNIEPLEIYISDYFQSNDLYLKNILNSITVESTNVLMKLNIENKYLLEQYINERKWSEIFNSSVSLYNINNTNIPFPELLPQLEVSIDMSYFDTYDKAKIDDTIKNSSFDIQINIAIGKTSIQKIIKKSFTDLGIKIS